MLRNTPSQESGKAQCVLQELPAQPTGSGEKDEKPSSRSSRQIGEEDDGNSSLSSTSPHQPPAGSTGVLSGTVSEVRDGIYKRDEEFGPPIEEKTTTTAPDPNDPNLVTWTGPDDPDNPKNWSFARKWGAVFVVSTFTLISPVSSSMVAPSLIAIGEELNITESFQRSLVLSIFVLGYAIGPLASGPLSELYGRVVVLQYTNLIYLFFNLGCGLARTKGQLIAFRFLSGLGGSASLAIGGGVLSDLFVAEQRGRAMSLYSLMPLLGPAIGPIAGAFITEHTTWRWSFWATTIADAAIQCFGLLFLRETYGPVLLAWKKRKLQKDTGKDDFHTPYDEPDRTVGKMLHMAFTRPFRLLATQIIVQVLSLYMMYLYGLMYIVLVSFPNLWSSPQPRGYGESVGIGGLNYVSLGLGFGLGAQICALLQDRIYAALKRRYKEPGRPEYRVPMMIPGALLVPIGLVIYGWTAEYKTHWIWPNVGACLFSAGSIVGFQCVRTYLVDSYTRYAASAVGAATVMRSLAAFGFPLFTPSLYDNLGLGWGNTLLAFLGVAIGWPSPVLLWIYGERLRKRSPFAAGG
ncbi:major facilitator superfamily transporter [Pseudomassariella vexata]|uniref:Major facilitator superfamily transporter n=1 Tax=Pseudomassariella vexata TaxID=1141098 RepID=A0A1Y2E0G7_9PEZI|nr:major facilitator superfamily transporter [Pseudomassariella vexata]ORY65032.1 major facilitator superfamily transporter [Pseudomassariella vexata]